jgi:hypothetical protein
VAGFDNDVVYADNVDFSGGNPVTGKVTTDGQLLIGATASPNIRVATLTAGTGITVTNGAGSITIAATGGGFTWTEVSGTTQNISVQNGYIANNAGLVTLTLPVTAAIGDTFQIVGKGAGLFTIAQNANQSIRLGGSTSTVGVGGSVAATSATDWIELVCTTANTVFTARAQGNFTVT